MRGFPKHINTKADVDYLNAHPEFAEQMKIKLEIMAQDSKRWVSLREVSEKEIVLVSETVKVIEEKQPDGTTKKYLYELKYDPNSILKRLGVEVKKMPVEESMEVVEK